MATGMDRRKGGDVVVSDKHQVKGMTPEQIMEVIDGETDPGFMSKEEALSFLEWISTYTESRIEALRDELATEERNEPLR